MKKEILTLNSVIERCPCIQGCHLCNGTGRFERPTTIKETYRYWVNNCSIDESFSEFMAIGHEFSIYEFDNELENNLHNWHIGIGIGMNIIVLQKKKIALLNVPIMTENGAYIKSNLSLDAAIWLISGKPFESAIGHQGTSDVLSTLFNRHVPVNRQNFQQQIDTIAIVLKINGRIPEGKILSKEYLEEIGYSFYLIERVS